MRWVFCVVALASCGGPLLANSECLPTFGDHCGCTAQCMTRGQISRIRSFCDLDCGAATWSCVRVGRSCEMDRDGDGRPDQRAGVDSGVEARVAAEGMGRDRGFYAGFGPESCAATEAGGASSALVWSAGAGAR